MELSMTCQPYSELQMQFVKMLEHKGWQWNADVDSVSEPRGFHEQCTLKMQDISSKQIHEKCLAFFFSGSFIGRLKFYNFP